jgi:TRAP-type C4-dicarboxylate transport system substrate-binding protein
MNLLLQTSTINGLLNHKPTESSVKYYTQNPGLTHTKLGMNVTLRFTSSQYCDELKSS